MQFAGLERVEGGVRFVDLEVLPPLLVLLQDGLLGFGLGLVGLALGVGQVDHQLRAAPDHDDREHRREQAAGQQQDLRVCLLQKHSGMSSTLFHVIYATRCALF